MRKWKSSNMNQAVEQWPALFRIVNLYRINLVTGIRKENKCGVGERKRGEAWKN